MNDVRHATREELQRKYSQPTRDLANSEFVDDHFVEDHLRGCADCRNQWRSLLMEEMPAAALMFDGMEEPEDLADCLQDDEAKRLVRGQMQDWEREAAGFHLEECAACRALIADLEAFARVLDASPLPQARAAATPTIAAPVRLPAWDKGTAWLRQLEAQVAAALQPLRPASLSLGFASAKQDKTRQILEFSDAELTGSYRAENDQRLIHLEHAAFEPGTLMLIEAEDETQQAVWRSFAVFRRGMRRAVLDVVADGRVDLRTLRVGSPTLERLPAESLAVLEAGYAAQTATDPAARSAWKIWAERVMEQRTRPELRAQALAVIAAIDAD